MAKESKDERSRVYDDGGPTMKTKTRATRRSKDALVRRQECCAQELRKTDKWVSGYNKDGDRWKCPACGKTWIYVEDEAEGGVWHQSPNSAPNDGQSPYPNSNPPTQS